MNGTIGEIRLFAGDVAPRDWAICNGNEIEVFQNEELFSIIGYKYGGNGSTTYNLPDLRGRTPIGVGSGPGLTRRSLGQKSGQEYVTLNVNELPMHNHVVTSEVQTNTTELGVNVTAQLKCSDVNGDSGNPSDAFPAKDRSANSTNYESSTAKAASSMNDNVVETTSEITGDILVEVNSRSHMTGANIPHRNMQPWLCLNYIICVKGYPPSQN